MSEQGRQGEIRILDLIRRASRGGACFSSFLSPDLRALALRLAAENGVELSFFGGDDESERVVLGFGPRQGMQEAPVAFLNIAWDDRFGSPGHRDLLGAILALGIERDCVGDIRLEEGAAIVAVLESMAEYIRLNLKQAGRVSVRVSRHEGALPPPEEGKRMLINVPSLRLDAVLQQTARLPRAKAKLLIEQGLCFVNWREELRADRQLGPGDRISLRGKGRIHILDVRGESKRGRLFIEIEAKLS
ncbi:MAG: hypothetical protein LBU47_06680 [Christensenellaceae bacterium]|jgi:RNA-binding protein YlmH|nr:hypothetical protein [Christensenellaceae bacterium]